MISIPLLWGLVLRKLFQSVPEVGESGLPTHIFAIDGSPYESRIDDRLPSTKVGYIKISTIYISMDEFGALRVEDGRFVDPLFTTPMRSVSGRRFRIFSQTWYR